MIVYPFLHFDEYPTMHGRFLYCDVFWLYIVHLPRPLASVEPRWCNGAAV